MSALLFAKVHSPTVIVAELRTDKCFELRFDNSSAFVLSALEVDIIVRGLKSRGHAVVPRSEETITVSRGGSGLSFVLTDDSARTIILLDGRQTDAVMEALSAFSAA